MIAAGVRDEIREVAPGLYLGLVYWMGLRVGRFALRFQGGAKSAEKAAGSRNG
jgi:hypothetical protein